ncbi:MAG TPA: hypothetical protein VGO47_10345 [Chlamydiales bacterium]|nr:hypothetical protein [Chlamydiales bacterium]
MTPPQALRASGRIHQRTIKKPARYNDAAPSPKRRRRQQFRDELPPQPPVAESGHPGEETTLPVDISPTSPEFTTERTSYGLFRVYPSGLPSWTPDEQETMEGIRRDDTYRHAPMGPSIVVNDAGVNPFRNKSTFNFMHWLFTGSATKTVEEGERLIKEVILSKDFNVEHFRNFRLSREARRLDEVKNTVQTYFPTHEKWIQTSVTISLPAEKVKYKTESAAPTLTIPDLFYKKPINSSSSSREEESEGDNNDNKYAEL